MVDRSSIAREVWQRPEYRKAHSEGTRAGIARRAADPVLAAQDREKRSANAKRQWDDPEYKQAKAKGSSASQRANWAKPEYRARQSAANSEIAKASWARRRAEGTAGWTEERRAKAAAQRAAKPPPPPPTPEELDAALLKRCMKVKRAAHAKLKRQNKLEQWTLKSAIARCECPTHPKFKYYGARGLTVDQMFKGRWGLHALLRDVGRKPGPDMSLDRVDNDKGYIPGNLRWADQKTQQNNRRPHNSVTPRTSRNKKHF